METLLPEENNILEMTRVLFGHALPVDERPRAETEGRPSQNGQLASSARANCLQQSGRSAPSALRERTRHANVLSM
jgi:hypothetical protein